MTKTIIAVLAALFITGAGIAYGETATVQVPFDYHGMSCWLESETTYQCTWQGEIEPVTIEELESFKDSISTEAYEEELARLTAPIVVEVVPELTKDEKTIQNLELKLVDGTLKTPDAVLLQMLRDLDECQQGLDNSSAIQNERTFVISQYKHLDLFNVQVVGQLGELSLAMEECRAQLVLEHHILTPAYKHFEDANRAGNFQHLESLKGVSAIPYEQYTKSDRTVDIGVICDSHAYPQSYKDQMGCEPIKYDGFVYPEGNGLISYYSPILEEYTFFMQDYGNKQATEKDKLIQANIAEPIARELIEDNTFYQNKIKHGD